MPLERRSGSQKWTGDLGMKCGYLTIINMLKNYVKFGCGVSNIEYFKQNLRNIHVFKTSAKKKKKSDLLTSRIS